MQEQLATRHALRLWAQAHPRTRFVTFKLFGRNLVATATNLGRVVVRPRSENGGGG